MYKKTFLALFDQAILSAINMLVAIMFIKFSTKIEYGEYSLAIAIIMFAGGLHNTLIHLPLTITGNKIDHDKQPIFSTSLCVFLYGILILLTVLSSSYVYIAQDHLLIQVSTCWSLIFAVSGILTRELARSLFFANLNIVNVFILDLIYGFLFVCLLVLLYRYQSLTASYIIMGMGLCSAIATIFFIKSMTKNLQLRITWKEIYNNIRFSWKDSKWMVSGMSMAWLVNNGYLFILAYLVSTESVAELNGTRILLVPLTIIMTAWGKIFMPKGASMVKNNEHKNIMTIMVKSTLGLLVVALCYIGVLFAMSPLLETALYNDKYDHVSKYILLWGVLVLITIVSSNLQNIISIFSYFKKLFFLSLMNSSLFLVYSYYLIGLYGAVWAVYSLIIAKIILSLQYGNFYYCRNREGDL